jgi:hypothetical protein
LEKASREDIDMASQSRPYYEAKRTLEELQRFRQILDMKIANEKVEVELPKTMLLELVDRAVPPQRPISPDVPRALTLIALGILLDIAGLLLLKDRPKTDSEPRPA